MVMQQTVNLCDVGPTPTLTAFDVSSSGRVSDCDSEDGSSILLRQPIRPCSPTGRGRILKNSSV